MTVHHNRYNMETKCTCCDLGLKSKMLEELTKSGSICARERTGNELRVLLSVLLPPQMLPDFAFAFAFNRYHNIHFIKSKKMKWVQFKISFGLAVLPKAQ